MQPFVWPIEEERLDFSCKHHLYGYKKELSVLSTGLTICQSKTHPGSVWVIDILGLNRAWHISELEKLESEFEIDEDGEIDNSKDSYCAVLLDKGYSSIKSTVRGIVPDEKPPSGWLSATQRTRNENLFSDRVVVKNVLGRLCTFNLIGFKRPWSEEKYCQFLRFEVALTNGHILWNPLRAGECILYRWVSNTLLFINEPL